MDDEAKLAHKRELARLRAKKYYDAKQEVINERRRNNYNTINGNKKDNEKTVIKKIEPIEPIETIEAMNSLRHLHQVAGMRFRSILKKKFETLDLEPIMVEGFKIVTLGDEAGVAKLGAYRCDSIGKDVFDVPESAVKQLQPGTGS